jgi:hypothetical protein
MAADGTTVPKATIHKDGYTGVGKIEVWSPEDIFCVESPSADASTHERKAEGNFCAPIAFPFYGRHNVGTGRAHSGEVAVGEFRFKVAFH